MIVVVLLALAEPTRLGPMRLLADGPEHRACDTRASRHMRPRLAKVALARNLAVGEAAA